MKELLRLDEELLRLRKPGLIPFSTADLNKDTLFVFCAGFEDRSIEVARRVVDDGHRGFHALVVEYLPAVKQNRLADLIGLLEAADARLDTVVYDREDPAGMGDVIGERVALHQGPTVVDVSGMSRLLIVQVISALCGFDRLDPVVLVYAEAQEYPPTPEEFEKEIARQPPTDVTFLSSGVFELTLVPELSSVVLQQRPLHVVLFPSFNARQTVTMCTELQATRWTIVHGDPPLPENAWRKDAIARLNRIGLLNSAEEVETSTLDYRETLDLLLRVYDATAVDHRLAVAPTGSKMQAVAIGLFRGFMTDVQIVYPTPSEFPEPEHYTRGVRSIYALSLAAFGKQRSDDVRKTASSLLRQ
jgi:hypothetical protein